MIIELSILTFIFVKKLLKWYSNINLKHSILFSKKPKIATANIWIWKLELANIFFTL